jgi:hypothetical protein
MAGLDMATIQRLPPMPPRSEMLFDIARAHGSILSSTAELVENQLATLGELTFREDTGCSLQLHQRPAPYSRQGGAVEGECRREIQSEGTSLFSSNSATSGRVANWSVDAIMIIMLEFLTEPRPKLLDVVPTPAGGIARVPLHAVPARQLCYIITFLLKQTRWPRDEFISFHSDSIKSRGQIYGK